MQSQSAQVTNHGLSRMSTSTIINNSDSSSAVLRTCVVVKRGLINTGHPDTHKYTPGGEEGAVEAKTKLYLTSSTCGLHLGEWACIPPLTEPGRPQSSNLLTLAFLYRERLNSIDLDPSINLKV